MKKQKKHTKINSRHIPFILIVAGFGLLGYLTLRSLIAANPYVAIEPESTNLSGLTKLSDGSASGGQFIQFGTSGTPAPSPSPAPSGGKKLILLQQGPPSDGEFAANRARYDSLPFDGVCVRINPYYSTWLNHGVSISQAQWAQRIAAMPSGMTKAKYNFLQLWTINWGDARWSDDAHWNQVASNVRNLTAAMKAAPDKNFVGIELDTEPYGTVYGAYSSGNDALAVRRGEQIMDAAIAGWDQIKVLATFGPPSSTPETYTNANTGWYGDQSSHPSRLGAYTYGMAKATYDAPNAKFLDGAEQTTGIRSASDAAKARAWFKFGWADYSSLVPANEKSQYKNRLSYAPTMSEQDGRGFFDGRGYVTFGASQIQEYLTHVIRSADEYAWFYQEQYEWANLSSGKPRVPQSYINAITNAVAAAQ